MANIFDSLFGGGAGEPEQPTDVESWAVRQYVGRARSREARQLTLQATRAGWPPHRSLLEFHKTQWPTVIHEAAQHFGVDRAEPLYRDHDTQVRALAKAVKVLFPGQQPGPILAPVLQIFRENNRN